MCANAVSWEAPLKVAASLLLLLSSLKWLSAALAWEELGQRVDLVLGLPENWVMLGIGLIECGSACYLLWPRSTVWKKAWLMVLLSLSWSGYQWLHAARSIDSSCPCLGQVPIWFPWLARFERELLTSLTLWFFLVGLALIVVNKICKSEPDTF